METDTPGSKVITRQEVLRKIFRDKWNDSYIDLTFPSSNPRGDRDRLARIVKQIDLPVWWGDPSYLKSQRWLGAWEVGVSGNIDQWGRHAMEILKRVVEKQPEEADLMFAPVLLWTHAVDWIQL